MWLFLTYSVSLDKELGQIPLEGFDRYLPSFAVTLSLQVLVVELRDEVVTFVGREDPDGLGNINDLVRAQIHANTMPEVRRIQSISKE
jgi:hypothetical protein